MMHPHTEFKFINETKGYGVVATEFIPKGTAVWVLDKLDRIFTPDEFKSMEKIYQELLIEYAYRDSDGHHILCWDHARFVNHSFNSNCLSTAYEVDIAIRDIQPDEELTNDYGYLNVEKPYPFPMESGSSRTCVMPDDILKYHALWDRLVLDGLRSFNHVAQSLAVFMDKNDYFRLQAIGRGEVPMKSILECYYSGSCI